MTPPAVPPGGTSPARPGGAALRELSAEELLDRYTELFRCWRDRDLGGFGAVELWRTGMLEARAELLRRLELAGPRK